jgi:hypothetical protein
VLALAEVAYACASTAVVMSVHNSIVCESLLHYGTDQQKERFLKRLAAGEIIGAFALTEPNAGLTLPGRPRKRATATLTSSRSKRFTTTEKRRHDHQTAKPMRARPTAASAPSWWSWARQGLKRGPWRIRWGCGPPIPAI